MPTRDLANQKITLWLGPLNSIADLSKPSIAEITAMKMISPAVRFDGYDFGAQASDSTDDRSLDDNAGATLPGFAQFGGGLPLYAPLKTDTSSILRQVYNIVKTTRVPLALVERVGYKSTRTAIAAYDNVNTYSVLTDGFKVNAEGDGGVVNILTLLPQGTTYPWAIVPPATAVAPTINGGATASLSLAGVNVALRGASYGGQNITARATWVSSNPAIATVDAHGVIQGVSIGTCNVTAIIPGSLISTAVAVTVAA
jgi:Bacterial Ig-like domain (group 2)